LAAIRRTFFFVRVRHVGIRAHLRGSVLFHLAFGGLLPCVIVQSKWDAQCHRILFLCPIVPHRGPGGRRERRPHDRHGRRAPAQPGLLPIRAQGAVGMALKRSDYAHFHVIERGGACCGSRVRSRSPSRGRPGRRAPRDGPHADRLARHEGAAPGGDGRPARERGRLRRHARRGRGGGDAARLRSFRFERREAHPLVELLPPLIHLRPAETPAAEWLRRRCASWPGDPRGEAGTETIVSRLTDVIFVQVLRAWIESLPEGRGGWMERCATGRSEPPSPSSTARRSGTGRTPRWPRRWGCPLALRRALHRACRRAAAHLRRALAARDGGRPPPGRRPRPRRGRARVGYESEAAFSKGLPPPLRHAPGAYRRIAAA